MNNYNKCFVTKETDIDFSKLSPQLQVLINEELKQKKNLPTLITQGDITFLKQLSKELNTQDNLIQAHPRYWCIQDEYKMTVSENMDWDGYEIYLDGEKFYDSENNDDNLTKLKAEISERFDKTDVEEDFMIEDCDQIFDYINSLGTSCEAYYYRWATRINNYSNCFLTNKAAKEHLAVNRYHYGRNARTYAMTALGNFEFEKVLEIIARIDEESFKGKH